MNRKNMMQCISNKMVKQTWSKNDMMIGIEIMTIQMIFQTSRYSNPNNSELLQVKDTKIGRELKH